MGWKNDPILVFKKMSLDLIKKIASGMCVCSNCTYASLSSNLP